MVDQRVGEPGLVPVDRPPAFEDEGAVDLRQHEGEVDVDAVVDGDARREVRGDGLDVAPEGTFPVTQDPL
jgi:hypothetical protein